MVKKGALLCPTLTMKYEFDATLESAAVPAIIVRKAKTVDQSVREAMRIAYRWNAPFAPGTDVGASSDSAPSKWGGNGREFADLVEEVGMTPLESIRASTANGPLTLGPQASKSGQPRAGFIADVIAVQEDPLKRIQVLGEPEHILKVWKDGKMAVDRTASQQIGPSEPLKPL